MVVAAKKWELRHRDQNGCCGLKGGVETVVTQNRVAKRYTYRRKPSLKGLLTKSIKKDPQNSSDFKSGQVVGHVQPF